MPILVAPPGSAGSSTNPPSARSVKARHASKASVTLFTPPPLPNSIICRRGIAELISMKGFLLVFDLDGTLVDSVPDLRAALNEMLREHGHQPLPPPQVKRMVGDGAAVMVARALAASGADQAEMPMALSRFLELYEANATRL